MVGSLYVDATSYIVSLAYYVFENIDEHPYVRIFDHRVS